MIAVLVNHLNPSWLPSGFLGVDVFFVISGFVVTSSLSNKGDRSWADYLLTFYSKRIKRLIPTLVVCVVLTSLVGCLFIDADLTKGSLRTGLSSLFGFSNIYILRQRTDYFGQSAELNLFTQTWSLGVEEQFYLLFPVLLGLCGYSRKRRPGGARNLFWAVLFFSTISAIAYLSLAATNPSAAFFLMPTRFWEVGAGCLIFLSRDRVSAWFARGSSRSIRLGSSAVTPPAFVSPLFLGLLLGVLCVGREWQTYATVSMALITTVLVWSFDRKGAVVKALSHPWLVQIGLLSYSLYLWHWSVIVISRWTVGVSLRTIPFQVALIVALSLASNRLIEKPMRYASWSGVKAKTIGYGFAATLSSAALLMALASPLSGLLYTGQAYPQAHVSTFEISEEYAPCRSAAAASADLEECFYPQTVSAVDESSSSRLEPVAATATPKTIYFVGDSHTGSLQSLASNLIENQDVSRIMMLERDGCLFSTSLRRVDTDGDRCLNSNISFLNKVVSVGNPGDVVVVTNRHSLYFLPPNSHDDILKLEKGMFSYAYEGEVLSQRAALERYSQDLVDISRRLAKKDIDLVVQASLPDWKHPPSQCQPQWFRPSFNLPEGCELDYVEEVRVRSPLLEVFEKMEAASPSLHAYDPFSFFCSPQNCSPFSEEGVPLFRDANHLNDYGGDRLYANFRRYLLSEGLIGPRGDALQSWEERDAQEGLRAEWGRW